MSDNQPGNAPDPNSSQPGAPVPPASQPQQPVPPAAPPAPPTQPPAAPPAGQPMPPQGYGAPAPEPKGLAITALIIGIVGLILLWVPVLGALLGLVGVILGILALKKRQSKGMSLTGLITGAVALIIGGIITVTFFVGLALLGSEVGNAVDAVEQCEQGATSVEIMGETIPCAEIMP